MANDITLFTLTIWFILAVLMLINIAGYLTWYRKSFKAISMGGACLDSSNSFKKLSFLMWILLGIALILGVFSMSSQHFGRIGILAVLNMTVLFYLVYKIKNILKRRKAARVVNLTITLVSCLILSILLTGAIAPELNYVIVEVKFPILYEMCLKDYLEMYDYEWEIPEVEKRYFRQTDSPLWQADRVYQLYRHEEERAEYIICWDNRIVYINFAEIPSERQIAIAAERLSNYR